MATTYPVIQTKNEKAGIGTNDPQEKLHVNGNLGLGTSPTIKWTSNTLRFEPFGDYIPVIVLGGTTSYAPRFEIKNAGDAATVVMLNGSGDSYINSGNVGIGSTNPNGKLDVTGDIWLNGDNVNSAYYLRINKGATSDGGILLYRGLSTIDWQIVNNATSGDLGFYSYGTSSQVFNVQKSSGYVGIGTNNPTQKLQVEGNSWIKGIYYDTSGDAGTSGQVLSSTGTGTNWVSLSEISGVDGSGTAGYVAFWSDSDTITGESNLFWDASNNRLGIGTPSPGSSLEVSGLTQTDKLRYNYPLSDKVYSGEIADFGLVESSSAGDIVYLNSSGKWVPARANLIANGAINMLGFYDGTDVVLRGPIRFGSSGGTTPRIPVPTTPPTNGQPLYLSPDVAGEIFAYTQLGDFVSGEFIRIIGHIIDYTNDVFYFNPDNTWVKKA